MEFETEYKKFILAHRRKRSGGRLRRLNEGHGHAERAFLEYVWWPTFHHFRDLHPEYEIQDYKDGYRYLDFAYIQRYFRVAIEIDGLGPHWRNITRWQFADHCNRQNHLTIDGWSILRFAYTDIEERPRYCQQMIQQLLGRLLGSDMELSGTTVLEREVIRLVIQRGRPIRPSEVCVVLGVHRNFAVKILHSLVQKQWLRPASGQVRVRSYSLHPSRMDVRL